MIDKVNTVKNFAIGGFMFLAQYVAPIIGKKMGLPIDIKELIRPNEFGVHLISSEIEKYSFELLELRLKSPNSLNHDLLRLSKTALNLSITKGINKLYKEEVLKKTGKDFEKEIDRQISNLDNKAKENFEAKANTQKGDDKNAVDNDVIKYVDSLNLTKDNAMQKLVEEISNDLPEICTDLPFKKFFQDNFAKMYQLYFGELLKKPEYSRALIAYQRQVQDLMMEAINQKNIKLTDKQIEEIGGQINKLASEDITNAIDEINKSLQDINKRLDKIETIIKDIKDFLISKTLIIEAIRGDTLWVKTIDSEIEIIPNNLSNLKERMNNSLFFKYKTDEIYYIEDNEEAFDYITKRTKVNEILIPNLLNVMKDICIKWDTFDYIYDDIEEVGYDGIMRNDKLLENCQNFISQNFPGIITPYIDSLYAIENDRESAEQEKRKGYIEECYTIVKRIVDLSVTILLSYLSENKDITIASGDKAEIKNYFRIASKTLKGQIDLLHRLINIFPGSTVENFPILLQKLLSLNERFSIDGKLTALGKELTELKKMADLDHDLNQFHNYRAEKILTEFLVDFTFLANYNMISIYGTEYNNIKKCEPKYIQYRSSTGFSKEVNQVMDKFAFSHAVMLINRTENEQGLNLYPFVIDRNALENKTKSDSYSPTIAFFNRQNINADYLDYDILGFKPDENTKEYRELHKKEIPKDNEYSESNIEQRNINYVLESFEKIKAILTEN